MKKFNGSTSVDYLYMESMLNKQIRSNIHMIQNKILSPILLTAKPQSQNQQRIIAKDSKDQQQQMIIQFQDNKILMSQLYQPMVIHSHRVLQTNKNCTFDNAKFKRNCCHHFNYEQILLKNSHYLKKEGQYAQANQQQQESKPWHPLIRMRRKNHIQNTFEQKVTQESQPIQGTTCFQPIADLSGWQTQEDPQIEIQ